MIVIIEYSTEMIRYLIVHYFSKFTARQKLGSQSANGELMARYKPGLDRRACERFGHRRDMHVAGQCVVCNGQSEAGPCAKLLPNETTRDGSHPTI